MTDLMTMPEVAAEKPPSRWKQFRETFARHYFRFDNAIIEDGDEFLSTLSKIIPGSLGALLISLMSFQILVAFDAGNNQAFALYAIGLIAAFYVTLSSVTNDDAMMMTFGGFLIMPSIPIGAALAAANAPTGIIVAVSVAFTFVGMLIAGMIDSVIWLYKAIGFTLKSDRLQMWFMRIAFGKARMFEIRTRFELFVEGEDGIEIYTIKGILSDESAFEWNAVRKSTCYDEVAKRLGVSPFRRILPEVMTYYLQVIIVTILSVFLLLLYTRLASLLITLLFRVL